MFADLFWDVADALQEHFHPAEALYYYTLLNNKEQVSLLKINDLL